MEEIQQVVIRKFNSLERAQIYRSLLASAGVWSVLQHDILNSVLQMAGGLLEVQLVVRSEDAERANEILAAGFDEQEFERETGGQ